MPAASSAPPASPPLGRRARARPRARLPGRRTTSSRHKTIARAPLIQMKTICVHISRAGPRSCLLVISQGGRSHCLGRPGGGGESTRASREMNESHRKIKRFDGLALFPLSPCRDAEPPPRRRRDAKQTAPIRCKRAAGSSFAARRLESGTRILPAHLAIVSRALAGGARSSSELLAGPEPPFIVATR